MFYWLTRTCNHCGGEDQVALTKREAAFGLYDAAAFSKQTCSHCNSPECRSVWRRLVPPDRELLDEWGMDARLTFDPQDEAVILAEADYVPLFLRAIDEPVYLPGKIDTLLEALCILLYDNTVNPEAYAPEENSRRKQIADCVRPELVQRKVLVERASRTIMGYVQAVVFPQIGLTINENETADGDEHYLG